jgi:hypothetical protein
MKAIQTRGPLTKSYIGHLLSSPEELFEGNDPPVTSAEFNCVEEDLVSIRAEHGHADVLAAE